MALPHWNTVVDGSEDLANVGYGMLYLGACYERYDGTIDPTGPPDGALVQEVIGQALFLTDLAEVFIVAQEFDGTPPAAGDALDFSYVNWDYKVAHALDGNAWERMYPKEFFDLTSTIYLDFSAAAVGDLARCRLDMHVYRRTAGGGGAPDTWVDAGAVMPDEVLTYASSRTTGFNRREGDFIRAKMFNQVRDAINLDVWTPEIPATLHTKADDSRHGSGTDPALWAAAVAAAGAGYAADVVGYTSTAPFGTLPPEAYTRGEFTGIVFSAQAFRQRAKFSAALGYARAGQNREVDFYVLGDSYTGVAADFDNNGDAVAFQLYKKFETKIQNGLGTCTSGFLGSLALPNWTDEPVDGGPELILGYVTRGYWMISRGDVAGGLVYTTATP